MEFTNFSDELNSTGNDNKSITKSTPEPVVRKLQVKRGDSIIKENGKLTKIIVSSSLISQFYYDQIMKEYCPRKVYHTFLIPDTEKKLTDSMIWGNYFEYLVLGATADFKLPELPKNKNGSQKVIQSRIEEQANFCKLEMSRMNIKPVISGENQNVQVVKTLPYSSKNNGLKDVEIILSSHLDLITKFALNGQQMPLSVIDIKLSADRYGLYTYYPWGNMEAVDKTQAYLYSYITKCPFYYWVWDNKPSDRGNRFIPIITLENKNSWKTKDTPEYQNAVLRHKELINSIETTLDRVLFHESVGWEIENPSKDNCRDCPFNPKISRAKTCSALNSINYY